jgi:RNA polymerase sigma-70 factor (ECF subfamily)
MRDPTLTRQAIEAVWRIEAARLIGGLVRYVGDLDQAEDLAQEALLTALSHWPESGIPDNPGAWLMTTAKHRALDQRRRRSMLERKHQALAHELVDTTSPDDEAFDSVPDDVLRLILVACHPLLSREARAALTLRLVAGLSVAEIARAFLSSEVTIGQRIVRAKRTLAEAKVPFEVPSGDALHARIPTTLEVVYLIFNEGYTATAGDDWVRPALCEEALRLGRMLAQLAPREAEAHGLLALMELQASRLHARVRADGTPVLLPDQDRRKWDRLLITRGLQSLARAEALARPLGPYTLQAALAACHARAARPEDTDWQRIVALYDALVQLTGSPVVELNRAVAVSMAFGPAAGLTLIDELADEPALRDYHLLPAARGDLLWRLGRRAEAKLEFERAAALTGNVRERALLSTRAAECADEPPN